MCPKTSSDYHFGWLTNKPLYSCCSALCCPQTENNSFKYSYKHIKEQKMIIGSYFGGGGIGRERQTLTCRAKKRKRERE